MQEINVNLYVGICRLISVLAQGSFFPLIKKFIKNCFVRFVYRNVAVSQNNNLFIDIIKYIYVQKIRNRKFNINVNDIIM